MKLLNPDLTIIIVNYNSGDFLSGTLEAIRKYPPLCEWGVIIVDNCSHDDSFTKAMKAVAGDTRFDFIEAEDNLGFAAGNNLGISKSSSRLILLLNPDTCLTDGAIDILINEIDGHSDYGVVGPKLVDENEEGTISFGWLPTMRGILSDAFLPSRYKNPNSGGMGISPDNSITEPLEVGYVSGACFLTTREIWDLVGPLDENYFAYFEETDWCVRLKNKGYKAVYIPESVVYHYEGKSFVGIPYRRWEIFTASARRFFKLHCSPFLGWFYIFANVVASVMKITYLTFTGLFSSGRRKRTAIILAHHRAFLRALMKK